MLLHPPSANDILNAVTNEDDFAHEVRVGAAIRSVPAFRVKHGGTYTDTVTGKPRQYDYRCWLNKESEELALAVECKNLKMEIPLIVSGLPRTDDEAFVHLVRSVTGQHDRGGAKIYGTSSVTRRAVGRECFYPMGEFVGKSLVRVKMEKNGPITQGDSEVYDKWSQALGSAIALVQNACDLSRRRSLQSIFTAVLPVVVVPDGTLWKIEYKQDGSVVSQPSAIEACSLFISKTITVGLPQFEHRFVFSHLHFFTLTGFTSFLSKMAVNDWAWKSLMSPGPDVILL
jgi:hypothetical protein